MKLPVQVEKLWSRQNALLNLKNIPISNGQRLNLFKRHENPVLTAQHVPISWIYDLNQETNPNMLERLGINAVFNSGAIYLNNRFYLVARIEGYDRKSFFGLAESTTGIDNFKFKGLPIEVPQTGTPDTNVYDMRLTNHEDGWIYGLFCTERRPIDADINDQTAAHATCGIIRTKDLIYWERLPDLIADSGQQRNVVLHPEFISGKYALYTRPQDSFIDAGSGGGIGWGLTERMDAAVIHKEHIIDPKKYHTISELKNGQGPAPIKTNKGWLHLAHGVRNTASGLRYVLYLFLTSLEEPWKIIHKPGGYFMAPEGDERIGDVSNVLFSNGWVKRPNGDVFIYYASSDTRLHVATTSVEHLIDYCVNTPADPQFSHLSVKQRIALIRKNEDYLNSDI